MPAVCIGTPPFVLLFVAQCDPGWGGVVLMPFRSQTFVGSNGSAAAEYCPAVTCGAYNVPTTAGQVLDHGIPFMHLSTHWAAMTLQADPLAAGMCIIARLFVTVFRGVPEVYNAGVCGQGELSKLPSSVVGTCKAPM